MRRPPVSRRAWRGIAIVLWLIVGGAARAEDGAGYDALFGTTGGALSAPTGNIEADAAALRTWMRDRLGQDAFYTGVLPRLFAVFSKTPWNSYFRTTLRTADVDGRTVYFDPKHGHDRKRPCERAAQVQVVPWWDGATKIWICTADYRPEVKTGDMFPGVESHCEVVMRPGTACGCGPHLVYCATPELDKATQAAAAEEPRRTAQDVIQKHLPFSTLLTRDQTVHAGVLDAVYRRFVQGEKMEPMRWAAGDRERVALRARPAPFTGGILSTPTSMNYDFARRVTGRLAWDDFLCMPLVAAQTHTEDIFKLPDANLRSHGQERLTVMVGCKECHKRLEGIVSAYADFTLPMVGHRYEPTNAPGLVTHFYGRDSHDLRADGPATPGFIAHTLVAQPEYTGCITRRVEQLFYGGEPVAPEVHEQLRRRFANGEDLASLIEDVAVVRSLGAAALDVPAKTVQR